MKWLVAIAKDANRELVFQRLRSLNCQVAESEVPMPLSDDEVVLSIEGPVNLQEMVKPYESLMTIYPDSKLEAY